MNDRENDVGRPADSLAGSEGEVGQGCGAPYEPPRLRVIGTMAELTRGVTGASDGLGPGSAF